MAWYAYCITERNAFSELGRHRRPMPLTGVTGLFGNQTFLFPAADLAVVVSEHLPEDAAKLVTAEGQSAAREHARVISGCFAKSTVLPFRFGTTFEDDEALRRSVRSNQRHFMANVERLRGMAEMHLKVVVDDICPETKGVGTRSRRRGRSICRICGSRQRGRGSGSRGRGRFRCRCTGCFCRWRKRLPASGWSRARCCWILRTWWRRRPWSGIRTSTVRRRWS
jgi:hypothetical protein